MFDNYFDLFQSKGTVRSRESSPRRDLTVHVLNLANSLPFFVFLVLKIKTFSHTTKLTSL